MKKGRKYIIPVKNSGKDIVFTILNEKSDFLIEKEVKNYIYIKVTMCLLILSKDYDDSSSDEFHDSFEFFDENNFYLTSDFVNHIKDSFFDKTGLSNEILEICTLSKRILFDVGWQDKVINKSKLWCLIRNKCQALLSILKVSSKSNIYDYGDLLHEDIIG